MRHVAQPKSHADQIEMIVGKRQFFSITDQRGQDHTLVHQSIPTCSQHGFVDVGMNHSTCCPHFFGERQRQIAGAACNVQNLVALFELGHLQRVGFPHTVQACRHQVVHDVVFGRYRIKNTPDMLGFFLLIDGFEAEMG